MKKRIFAVVMAVVMLFACLAFAGCQDKETNKGNEAGSTAPAASAKDDLAAVKTNGKMVIGITYFAPMNYFNDNNELTGFETDFANAVCEKLGVQAEFKEIVWETKLLELNSGNIDCIWNGMTIKEDLKGQLDFSEAYMANKQVCVVKTSNAEKYKDLAGIDGASVAVETGSAGDTIANETAELSKNVIGVSAQSDTLKEVKAGTADVAVIDAVMAYSMVGEDTDFSDLTVIDLFDDSANEEYGIGFRTGSTLTAEINKIMHELAADGTLAQIAKNYGLESRILIEG